MNEHASEIESLRERVKALRGQYDDISRLSGMSVSWISKFGRGRYRSPRYDTVKAVEGAVTAVETGAG